MTGRDRHPITLAVNGREQHLAVEPRRLLSDVLRHRLGLTGTHVGCEQGACGSCTVLLDGAAVRSCTVLAVSCDGGTVGTVEGLSTQDTESSGWHVLQQTFRDNFALQCGFCTPGMLMLAASVLDKLPAMSDQELRELLAGQLCRCTGYEPIVAALRAAGRLVADARSAEQ
jgi:carbon-monoxide dehydrogenase small subunit